MKKRNLLYGVLALLVPASIVFLTNNVSSSNVEGASYTPRLSEADRGYAGAIDYLNSIRANQVTGTIEMADVEAARQLTLASANKRAALNLEWEEMGPDNVGGRTRVILFDRNDHTKIYAAGVAGGLWVSTNSGGSWQAVDGIGEDLAIVSMTQAANGDLYYGTGENNWLLQRGITLGTENGASGFPGSGVWKSTDGGQTFSHLASTTPNSSSTTGATWRSVSKLEAHPTNPNRIYAATNRGLLLSDDAGGTWTQVIPGTLGGQLAFDVEIASDGTVYATVGTGRLYKSTTGDVGSFTQINTTGSAVPNIGIGRFEIAIAPSDPNYIYVSAAANNESILGVWRSTDAGANWTQIGQSSSTLFSPFTGGGGQGVYDQALAVFPDNKDRIALGGVTLWTWSTTNGWNQVDNTIFTQFTSPNYVHADKHIITFQPVTNHMYIGSDGGIGRSKDGGSTFHTLNINYSVTQFYTLDFNKEGHLMGGTQDNGTLVINQTGNTSKSAFEVLGGDGAFCDFSDLNPEFLIASSQNAAMRRTNSFGVTGGGTFETFLPSGAAGGAFVTPTLLYETEYYENSRDSIVFSADTLFRNLGAQFSQLGGVTTVNSQIIRPQESSELIPESFIIQVGPTGAATTKIGTGTTNSVDVTAPLDSFEITGDFTGVFNSATGEFYTELQGALPPSNDVFVKSAVQYSSGAVIKLISNTADYPYYTSLASALAPGESVKIIDKIRANFFVGLSGQIWMCPNILEFDEPLEWYQISSIIGVPQSIEISRDGDMLLVGTSGGRLYRVTGLADVHDTATSVSNVTTDLILSAGQVVTGMAINPHNKDQVLVTLGNYGNSSYVRMSNNATAATPAFTSKQGIGLPDIPVYDAVFNQGNPSEVILGTDMGIWTTDNINAGAPSWTQESAGLGNVPVFVVKQQFTLVDGDSAGTIYAATHGRGFFKSGSARYQYIGVDEPETEISRTDDKSKIKLFPNPVSTYTTVAFDLTGREDVKIQVRDIQGRLVKSITKSGLSQGSHDIKLDLSTLRSGTYIMSVDAGEWVEVSKFIVNK